MSDSDLVTISEAARELNVKRPFLDMAAKRARQGSRRRQGPNFPEPAVEGRSVRLWNLNDLRSWVAAQGEEA